MRNMHRKALRTIGSALLNSELNPSDLRNLATDFHSSELQQALTRMIMDIAIAIEFDDSEPRFGGESVSDEGDENIHEFVHKKRLSRLQVISALRALTNEELEDDFFSGRTIREMLDFFNKRYPQRVGEFKQLILGAKIDPYLKGIMNYRKR